jgi:hypothetical protein
MLSPLVRLRRGLRRRWAHTRGNARTDRIAGEVARAASLVTPAGERPVVFFNASTRLLGMSLNAAFQQAAAWAVQLAGVPAVQFVCQGGLSRCVLGTDRDRPEALPPCPGCIAQSRAQYEHSDAHWFIHKNFPELNTALQGLDVAALTGFEWQGVPLGVLCLPALRWAMRLHSLPEDEPTRFLYREYIQSAWTVAGEFGRLLDALNPQAVVVFNGMFYPEATARWVARQRGLRVISHEVGLRPFTAFFTTGDATAYPIQIPDSFQLNAEQNARLDAYLEQRLQGNFSMAGVRFWPEMRGLDERFLTRLGQFKQVVPVFTNVIFDTSQPHSNTVFPQMFAWLDQVLETARMHPETLFVVRAHPDETRPGKASRESVAMWAADRHIQALPNVEFVDSREYFSSYELIQRSKFVMVYNSTIGLEASIMGAPVLCGGKARFTQLPTVFFPPTPEEYRRMAEEFLAADSVQVPPEFRLNARRFLYFQLYKTSLPFGDLLEEDGVWPGYVRFKDLPISAFDSRNSKALHAVVDGILGNGEFVVE